MSGLRRPSGPCCLLVSLLLVLLPRLHAENPASSTADGSTAKAPGAVSPELQGDLLMAYGHYAAAIRAYQQQTTPSAVVFNKIGIAYHHMLGFAAARRYYKKALAINPHYAQALSNLASVYFNDRDFGHAEQLYKRSLSYRPNQPIVLSNLGAAYFADDKYKLGMDAYQKAIALDPGILHPDPHLTIDEGSSQGTPLYDYYLAELRATESLLQTLMGHVVCQYQLLKFRAGTQTG